VRGFLPKYFAKSLEKAQAMSHQTGSWPDRLKHAWKAEMGWQFGYQGEDGLTSSFIELNFS
jgi:hypothetical protein